MEGRGEEVFRRASVSDEIEFLDAVYFWFFSNAERWIPFQQTGVHRYFMSMQRLNIRKRKTCCVYNSDPVLSIIVSIG